MSDGTRTRDRLDHNQELYQLSYAHQGGNESSSGARLGSAAAVARSQPRPGTLTGTLSSAIASTVSSATAST